MQFFTLLAVFTASGAALATQAEFPAERKISVYSLLDGKTPTEVSELVKQSEEFFAAHDAKAVEKRQESCVDQCYFDWCGVFCSPNGCDNFAW
jgi:hypothetical protein